MTSTITITSTSPLLVLAPLQAEVQDLLRALGPGEPVAVPGPGKAFRCRRKGRELIVGWSGMGAGATRRSLEALLVHAPAAVLHLGVAGALRKELVAGDAVSLSAVHRGSERRELASGELVMRLRQSGAREGASVTVDAAAGTPAAKAALAARHPQALVVEMESWWAAEVVGAAGVPFAGLRVVVDTLDQPLPDLSAGLDEVGNPRPLKLAATLVRSPGALRHLPAIGKAFARSRARLVELALAAL